MLLILGAGAAAVALPQGADGEALEALGYLKPQWIERADVAAKIGFKGASEHAAPCGCD